ncbi:MAG: hypothetical protein DIU79_16965 [Actinobacteria bacterium]|nr:MAG: hypothetical protein DIU79_16965 [Actinomycetota bacterium]
MATQATIEMVERLEAIGGNRWQKGAMDRVYFNDLARWYGLEVTRYNTGNVSSARLHGERISNSHAREILGDLAWAKVWFDANDGRFYGRNLDERYFGRIVEAIKAAAAAVELESVEA